MSLLMWKMKSLEGASVVERNEEFPIESLGISRIYLAVCQSTLCPPCLKLPFLSPLALFLWPFDLSERVWSFKVLLFPLSGVPLFLHSGLGFQSGGSFVHWLGGSGGWAQVSMRWWDWGEVGGGLVCDVVRRGPGWLSSENLSSHLTQPQVATGLTCWERWVYINFKVLYILLAQNHHL